MWLLICFILFLIEKTTITTKWAIFLYFTSLNEDSLSDILWHKVKSLCIFFILRICDMQYWSWSRTRRYGLGLGIATAGLDYKNVSWPLLALHIDFWCFWSIPASHRPGNCMCKKFPNLSQDYEYWNTTIQSLPHLQYLSVWITTLASSALVVFHSLPRVQ